MGGFGVYEPSPGRGRAEPIDEMLIMLPPPALLMEGTTAGTEWKMDLTLMLKTRSKSASVTSRVGCQNIPISQCYPPSLTTQKNEAGKRVRRKREGKHTRFLYAHPALLTRISNTPHFFSTW